MARAMGLLVQHAMRATSTSAATRIVTDPNYDTDDFDIHEICADAAKHTNGTIRQPVDTLLARPRTWRPRKRSLHSVLLTHR